MIRIPLKVKANLLTQEELVTIASGSSNSIKVKFDIDPNSDFADSTLQKRAIFRYYQGSYFISDVDANGEVYVPKFVIAYPYFKVALRAESENATIVVTTNEVQVPVEKSPVFYETTITDGDVTIRNLDGALNIYKAGDVTFIDFTVSYKTAVDAVIAGTYATTSALNSVASDVDSIKEDIINMSNSISDLQDDIANLDTTKADKADTYKKTETEALLAGKQDVLVSGENIKTINGVSLVGSGNYDFDSTLDEASTNAVQNKVITEYITDLESKVSTLAVKVYNHDVALGTLNIENVLYSVENTDSFAIPTTIGTNADVVIPKSRMALNTIKGKTEYSRNLHAFSDSIVWTSASQYATKSIGNNIFLKAGTYTLSFYVFGGSLPLNKLLGLRSGQPNLELANPYQTYTNGERVVLTFTLQEDVTFISWEIQNYQATTDTITLRYLMLNSGNTALPYVPYYTGLKNVELNSLNVYGESDEYTSLNANDRVSAIRYFYPTTTLSFDSAIKLVDKDGNIAYTVQVYANHETLGAFTRIWRGNYTTVLIDANTAGMNGVYKLDGVYKVLDSDNRISYGALNATSVKPILPSSILPKTLPAYERLEVVDNNDDTYKIDLVSHAELHVGDEINSLWVGNPQSTNYSGFFFGLDNSSKGFIQAELYGSRVTVNDNMQSSITNSDLISASNRFVFGGDDSYVSGDTTNRNVILKFTANLTISSIPSSSFFNSDFRNGEETRTTLIDGLSLDDVSAVIDTNDIVYADNSNAEYDVSIAETSVELLVNKAN